MTSEILKKTQINVEVAKQFLTLLDPTAEAFTFQALDDSKENPGRTSNPFNCNLDEAMGQIAIFPDSGIFVTINQTNLHGSRTEDIRSIRAVFADADTVGFDYSTMAKKLPPHCVIESSPGKRHIYWMIEGNFPLDKFTPIQTAIARQYGTDPAVSNVSRIMRLPGSTHQKGNPFQTRIIEINSDMPRYSTDDIINGLELILPPPVVKALPKKPRNEPPAKTQSALDKLPIDVIRNRESWFKIGCALHHEFEGSEEGFKLWDTWSQKTPDVYGGTEATWNSFKRDEDGITIRTLYKMASENGWSWIDEPVPKSKTPITATEFTDWMEDLTLSEEEANAIANPDWIIEDVVIQGHLIAIPAKPNGGKTTIFFYLAGLMAAMGFKVFYVNSDIAGGDAKTMRQEAVDLGVTLVLPDFRNSSMNKVVEKLEELNAGSDDLGKMVFIFDTLKKMTDVIEKGKSKRLYATLRGLTAKGATVILLAHTNKYNDSDGMPVYEGTGDLRADVDELIYLISDKHPDGSMTVSTKLDKVRGAFKPVTFEISADRKVKRAEVYVDTLQQIVNANLLKIESETIEAISSAINSGENTRKLIIAYCKDYGIGRRSVDFSLGQNVGKLWTTVKGEKNALIYSLIS